MNTWENWSDFDVNVMMLNLTAGGLVSNIRQHRLKKLKPYAGAVVFDVKSEEGADLSGIIDFCNSWADMGPIIVENKIDIFFNSENDDGAYKHIDNQNGILISNKNPLRAAAIVYLEMKGVQP